MSAPEYEDRPIAMVDYVLARGASHAAHAARDAVRNTQTHQQAMTILDEFCRITLERADELQRRATQ